MHIESATELIQREQTGVAGELESHILHLARDFPEIKNISGIEIRKVGESFHVILHSVFDPDIEVTKAHEISTRLEHAIEKAYPNVTRIDIHEEPDVAEGKTTTLIVRNAYKR